MYAITFGITTKKKEKEEGREKKRTYTKKLIKPVLVCQTDKRRLIKVSSKRMEYPIALITRVVIV